MKLHRLSRTTLLPVDLDRAWDYFSDPRNLPHLTPPWLHLAPTSPLPERMHPGMIVTYSVRPALGIPVHWVTEITHVVPGQLFVDEQRSGPYRFWHHQHHFRAVPGGVEMRDIVHYALPFGALGNLAASAVHQKVASNFDYRAAVLERTFPANRTPSPAGPHPVAGRPQSTPALHQPVTGKPRP